MSDDVKTAGPEHVAAEAPPAAAPRTYDRERSFDRGGDRGGPRRKRFPRRKICYFTLVGAEYIDYKDVNTLRRFVTDRGKIMPRRMTGTSAKFQRLLTSALKRARHMALLAYVAE